MRSEAQIRGLMVDVINDCEERREGARAHPEFQAGLLAGLGLALGDDLLKARATKAIEVLRTREVNS